MAHGTVAPPGLSLPRETFAKLTPAPFLQAHLQRSTPSRPNGRALNEHRKLTVNSGSLTHTNGSAVVRSGDTAVVCGVRAETLLASDVPHPPSDDGTDAGRLEELSLLVPNLELSTGCSPANLPGNPPGTLAQSLSYRILSTLHASKTLDLNDLKIQYEAPRSDDDVPDQTDQGPNVITKAYWVLYIDILCIALDGNAFDTAWAAVVAALNNTRLPRAWWDPDREGVLCSPHSAQSHGLTLRCLPVATTFSLFATSPSERHTDEADHWILADPDAFEQDVSSESLTIVTAAADILRVEKSGGLLFDRSLVAKCFEMSKTWRAEARSSLSVR